MALGTVYHYFSSKEHLLAEALVQWAATLRTNITSRPLAGTTPAERLAETLRRSVRAFQRRPQLARLVSTLEVSSDPVAAEMLARLSDTITEIYLDQLADLERADRGSGDEGRPGGARDRDQILVGGWADDQRSEPPPR